MNIQFEWPASRTPVALTRDLTAESAAVFDVTNGILNDPDGCVDHDAVIFYWHQARPVMLNMCATHICLLDGIEVQYGCVHPLRSGSKIQAGHFRLLMSAEAQNEADEQNFNQIIYSDGTWPSANNIPEVENILPNSGNYINDLRYFNDVIAAHDLEGDILKKLEVEYKRFLIWQEQDDHFFAGATQQANHIIKTDQHFERVREQTQGKTLTECIVAKEFLMEKVWPELEQGEYLNELFIEEEKCDLLKLLSPEHVVLKGKNKVPELVFQNFYKVGLDSYY